MLGVAGYLNYANDPARNFDVEVTGITDENLGEAVLVDSTNLVSNIDGYMDKVETDKKLKEANEYFAESRIERNKSFDERIEVYEKMLERGIMISAQAGANRVSVGLPEHNELFIKKQEDGMMIEVLDLQ